MIESDPPAGYAAGTTMLAKITAPGARWHPRSGHRRPRRWLEVQAGEVPVSRLG